MPAFVSHIKTAVKVVKVVKKINTSNTVIFLFFGFGDHMGPYVSLVLFSFLLVLLISLFFSAKAFLIPIAIM